MSKFYDLIDTMIDNINYSVKNNTQIEDIRINSNKEVITLSMCGSGSVKILGPYEYKIVDLTETLQTINISNENGTVYIQNISGLQELDAHSQGITSFVVNGNCNINKLVLYDNQLQKLDLFNCKKLQFLHMHNNPICDDDTYIDNLTFCMNSLTDRCMSATASIVLYPWYGLEVLICKDPEDDSRYIKYPSGHVELVPEDGRLYGIVDSDTITYCIYEDGEYREYPEMNRHHQLRKQLEKDICLKKNWIFGSAIMYDENDWARCPWDFREGHIADMWETAEKGFGTTMGFFDEITNTLAGFKYFNVIDHRCCLPNKENGEPNFEYDELPKIATNYLNPENKDLEKECYKSFLNGELNHGDHYLSVILGNGVDDNGTQRFGYIPNCSCCLVDMTTQDGYLARKVGYIPPVMNFLTNYGCDGINVSINMQYTTDRLRQDIGVYSENNILTISAGNEGDGLTYTTEMTNGISSIVGDYNVTIDGETVSKPCCSLIVGALTPDKRVAPFSNSAIDCTNMTVNKENYISYFGENIPTFHNTRREMYSYSGTSGSSPLCCAVLMMLKIIYKKMFPDYHGNFGTNSPFMHHVRQRWCEPLIDQMDYAVGFGMPNIFAEPYAPSLLKFQPSVTHNNSVFLGDPININYTSDVYSKQSYTVERKLSSICIDRSGDLYPLFENDSLDIKLYSNSGILNSDEYKNSYFVNNVCISVLPRDIGEVPGHLQLVDTTFSNDYVNESVIAISDRNNTSKEFTVHFAIDFTNKLYPTNVGSYTSVRDLLYFIVNGATAALQLKGITYSSGDKYVNLKSAGFTQVYLDRNGIKEFLSRPSIGRKIANSLDMSVSSYAIITVTGSPKYGVCYFLNGTLLGYTPNYPTTEIQVSDLYVNKDSLCHDAIGCVRIYDRVLTDNEIIQNTIHLLNCHFEEET